jgi:cell division protein FtsI (penicillin-binding protein 3)
LSTKSGKNIHFRRIYIIIVGILVFWLALESRLFIIQVRDHGFYVEQSKVQSAKKVKIAARRGNIYDRNQESLATDLIQYDLGVDLNKVANKNAVATTFAKYLKHSKEYYLKRMNTSRDFSYLARKVSREKMLKIWENRDPGIVRIENYRRFYPFSKYGSQVTGFTDVDNKGMNGIELQFEDQLRGKNGWTFLMADARRRFGYNVDYPNVPSQTGVNIVLTIDKNFQTIVQDEVDLGVKKYHAKYGMAVMMNPMSGEILAMYCSPGFDPNNASASSISQRRNRVITDIFEPGSTFKIFPAAALLQENIKKPDDIVFCENGKYRYYNHTVNDSKKHAWLSFQKVVENSSNIGMVKLSADISKNTFYQYIKNFGFDSRTGIDLMGESTGLLSKPKDFSGLSKGVISFGQEIGVTALQLTNAYCAIINGGKLQRPYLISEIVTPEGKILTKNETKTIRRVISEDVAETLKQFMIGAVQTGTGKKAQIEGVTVGGKTGTAQKYDKSRKRYFHGKYLASFIGFAPAEHPEYVLAIFLDNPGPSYYGGDVAAPIFRNILKRVLNFAPSDMDDVDGDYHPKYAATNSRVPNFAGLSVSALEDYFDFKDEEYQIKGQGNYVVGQGNSNDPVEFRLGKLRQASNEMPNLKGLTIREALKKIDFSRYRVKIKGTGRIKKQSIKAGITVTKRSDLQLTCQ